MTVYKYIGKDGELIPTIPPRDIVDPEEVEKWGPMIETHLSYENVQHIYQKERGRKVDVKAEATTDEAEKK